MYVDFLENIDIGINYIDYNWKDDGALMLYKGAEPSKCTVNKSV